MSNQFRVVKEKLIADRKIFCYCEKAKIALLEEICRNVTTHAQVQKVKGQEVVHRKQVGSKNHNQNYSVK